MLPKQDNNSEFQSLITQIRKENSNTTQETVGSIRTSVKTMSNDVVDSVDSASKSADFNASQLIENITKSANKLKDGMGESNKDFSSIKEINVGMLKEEHNIFKFVKKLHRLQAGGRVGFGELLTLMRQFRPWTIEARNKGRDKQANVMRSITLGTYEEIIKLRKLFEKSLPSQEDKHESKLDSNGDVLSKKDRKAFENKGFLSRLILPLLNAAIFGPITVAALVFVNRLKMIGDAIFKMGKIVKFIFAQSGLRGLLRAKKLAKIRLARAAKVLRAVSQPIDAMVEVAEDVVKAGKKASSKKGIFGKIKSMFKSLKTFAGKFDIIGLLFKKRSGTGFIKKIMKFIGPVLDFIKPLGKMFKPFMKIGGKLLKFVPFLNVIMGIFDVISGAMKGMDQLGGGWQGALIGGFGGLMEFISFGIFDMQKFLDTAKVALAKFKDGDWVGGILGLIQAPLDGIKSGIQWLMKKVFGAVIGASGWKPGEDSGYMGKALYWIIKPWQIMIKVGLWFWDKISGFFAWFRDPNGGFLNTIDSAIMFFSTGGPIDTGLEKFKDAFVSLWVMVTDKIDWLKFQANKILHPIEYAGKKWIAPSVLAAEAAHTKKLRDNNDLDSFDIANSISKRRISKNLFHDLKDGQEGPARPLRVDEMSSVQLGQYFRSTGMSNREAKIAQGNQNPINDELRRREKELHTLMVKMAENSIAIQHRSDSPPREKLTITATETVLIPVESEASTMQRGQ